MTVTEATVRSRRETTRAERVARRRQEGFPSTSLKRWLVRLAFASPFAAVALISNLSATLIAETPNAFLVDRVALIDWGQIDIAWMQEVYPPITTLLASILPGGRLGLALFGAFVAGLLLHRLLEIMVQRHYPPGTVVFLLIAFGANPMFAYTVTENFEGIVCLAFFGVGLADTVRFFTWNDTRAGFRAGLLFMLAVLSSPAGLLYVLVAMFTAPFLRLARADQEGARATNVLILAYPAISSLLAFAFLEWAFLGSPFGFIPPLLEGGIPFSQVMTTLFTTFNGFLVIAPVLSAWLLALIVRKFGVVAISTFVFMGVVANAVFGFLPTNAAGDTFLLMVLMAIVLIPLAKSLTTVLLVDAVAILQIVIAWTATFNREIVTDWITAFVAALSA